MRILIAVIAVLVTIVCVARIVRFVRAHTRTVPVRTVVLCDACRAESVHEAPETEVTRFPVVCPRCGAHAARPLYECHACHHRWAPPLGQFTASCPKCNSPDVGFASPPPVPAK